MRKLTNPEIEEIIREVQAQELKDRAEKEKKVTSCHKGKDEKERS